MEEATSRVKSENVRSLHVLGFVRNMEGAGVTFVNNDLIREVAEVWNSVNVGSIKVARRSIDRLV